MSMKKAVVLWSGGIDSTGLILWALGEGFEVYPLFLNRHQSNYKWEKKAIEAIYLEIINNYPNFKLHKYREYEIISPPSELKEEFSKSSFKFVYFLRNSDLLNNAVRLALCIGARNIYLGSIIDDIEETQNFPDNHPKYLDIKNKEINTALNIMNEKEILIKSPFIENKWSKKDIINFIKNNFSQININLTRSCYAKSKNPCGICRACRARLELSL